MEKVNESHEKAITLAFAEAAKRITEFMEINIQMNKTPLFLPSFASYEKARQEGQLAFFRVMDVKCRPLNPAESVRHKGTSYILTGMSNKEEAQELTERVHNALKVVSGINLSTGEFLTREEVR